MDTSRDVETVLKEADILIHDTTSLLKEERNPPEVTLREAILIHTSSQPLPSSPVPPPHSPTLRTLLAAAQGQKIKGVFRVALLLLARPLLSSLLWRMLPAKRRHNVLWYVMLAFTCTPALTRSLVKLFKRTLGVIIGNNDTALSSGVFTQGKGSARYQAITAKLQEKVNNYWINPFLNGDYATIFPTAIDLVLSNKVTRNLFPKRDKKGITRQRQIMYNRQHAQIALDWTFPAQEQEQDTNQICIFLAGVGGDSSSPYIKECNEKMTNNGWTTVTLNPRGLKSAPSVTTLEHSFSPYNLDDLDDLLLWIETKTSSSLKIVLIGFSLGAISLGKYLSSRGADLDERIVGAVMVSGAFGMDFAQWWRYREIFQALIVPELVLEFLAKYGHLLEQHLSTTQMSNIGSATTYQEMVENLLLPVLTLADQGRDPMSYSDFQAMSVSTAEEVGKISCPTLFMASLDDPLHSSSLLNITKDMLDGKGSSSSHRGNVCYMLLEEGGHVNFPTDLWGGSSLLQSTVFEWAMFCVEEADEKRKEGDGGGGRNEKRRVSVKELVEKIERRASK